MLILSFPASSANCGASHPMARTASGVAWGRMKRLPPRDSISTIRLTVTSPMTQLSMGWPLLIRDEHADYGVSYTERPERHPL